MSHVFEHMLNLSNIISILHSISTANGLVIISVPNMEAILSKRSLPPGSLSFEHTVYLSTDNIVKLFKEHEFSLRSIENYIDHSVFLCFEKDNKKPCLDLQYSSELKNVIIDIFAEKELDILRYNKYIDSSPDSTVFIYGAHIQTQILQGLGIKNIHGTLDNDVSKHGKVLYGNKLMTYPPDYIKGLQNPIVICDMGIYNQEITAQLRSLNDQVIIL
jgi:hypothetical protein